eukprot:m.258805 g.258805  ORF g.258805 m.258805 type:complete len:215 (-) comp37105_c0_seq1:171-815(-)
MFSNKSKTYRAKKNFKEGTIRYQLHKKATKCLESEVDLQDAVKLPAEEERNEWLAVHVVDFFNRINLIYGTVCDFCTEESCPRMSGGPQYEYQWQDSNMAAYKKPVAVPAPKYIDLLMDWTEGIINDDRMFPPLPDIPFPKNFVSVVKQIFRRLFRVFVHVYYHHFKKLAEIGAEPHVNTCFKHFYYFVVEFELIDTKELAPLTALTKSLIGTN